MSAYETINYGFLAVASFIYFGFCVFYLGKASGLFSRLPALQSISVSLAFAPVALAWTYGCLLRIVPGYDPRFYVIAVAALPLPIFVLSLRRVRASFQRPLSYTGWLTRGRHNPLLVISALAVLAMLSITLTITARSVYLTPIATNDPMEYFAVARAIFEYQRLAGVYPVLDENISSGFYGPWTHPPGFVLLISWLYALQGSASHAGIAKFVNLYCVTAMALLLFAWSGGFRRFRGLACVSLAIMTPLFLGQAFSAHVDILRVTAWTALFCLVPSWLAARSLTSSIAFGCLVGLSLFVHSLGVLFFAFLVGLVVVLQSGHLLQRVAHGALAAATAALIVLPDYVENMLNYGYIIGDSVAIWQIPELEIANFLNKQRNIFTFQERIFNGVFSPFLNTSILGFSGIVFIAFLFMYLFIVSVNRNMKISSIFKKITQPTLINVLILSMLAFILLLASSTLIGSNLMIKNLRYLSTMTGVAAIAAIIMGDTLVRYGVRAALRVRSRRIEVVSQVRRAPRSALAWSLQTLAFGVYLPAAIFLAWMTIGEASSSSSYWRQNFPVSEAAGEGNIERVLACSANPPMQLIGSMNAAIANRVASAPLMKVLSFFPSAPALYGHFDIVSYLDPRLVEAYLSDSNAESFAKLSNLGIAYVFLPAHQMGEIENSAFKDLFADPAYFRVEQNIGGYALLSAVTVPPLLSPDGSSRTLAKGELLAYDFSDPNAFATAAGGSNDLSCYDNVVVTGSGSHATLSVTGPLALFARSLLDIDVTKQYRVSFEIRVPTASGPSNTYGGLATFNARRELESEQPGTYRYGVLSDANIQPSGD